MQYYLMKSYGGYSIAIEVLFWVGGFFWCLFCFLYRENQVIIILFHLMYKIGASLYCFFLLPVKTSRVRQCFLKEMGVSLRARLLKLIGVIFLSLFGCCKRDAVSDRNI